MKAIILDTETTGLRQPEPCEIAFIQLCKEPQDYPQGSLLAETHIEYQHRFRVSKPIEPGATKIHGISHTDLVGKPHWTTFKLPQAEYIIGHKVDYDARVLGWPEAKYICTCNLARLLWPELPNHKLTTIVEEKFPKQAAQLTKNAHGALVDCKLCLLILEVAIAEFEGLETWQDMYEMAGVTKTVRVQAPKVVSKMPFGKHKGRPLAEVPVDYLRWVLNNANPNQALRDGILQVLGEN